jgi:dienelactone hydrolase
MILPLLRVLVVSTVSFTAEPDTAFLTFEAGQLVGVDWIQRRGSELRTRSVLMRSGIRDVRITLGAGGTARKSSAVVSDTGKPPSGAMNRDLGEGVTYWSDQVPSSIEQALHRAEALGSAVTQFPGASLYRDAVTSIAVERVDSTDWVLTCNHKRYLALTDAHGDLLSATLPDYGVVIERRIPFRPSDYPLWGPHDPAPDAPYRAEEARIGAPGGHVLAGTLTVPKGPGPFPAVVLITGLSANNRNNGDPPWMPFRDLADALSHRGVVVLRVDDRGVEASTGDRATSTTFDEADDVRSELAWLRARPEVAAKKTFLVGYSEGGLIAPIVAARDPNLAGIVTLAGPGVQGPEVARYQIEAAVSGDTSIAPEKREAEIERQLGDSLTIREKTYLSIDPLAFARRVRCPALILQGGSDRHVPVRSAEKLAFTMRQSGNSDVSVRIFPGLSHTLLPDPYGLSSGWAALPGFMTSPDVLRAVGDWIDSHSR